MKDFNKKLIAGFGSLLMVMVFFAFFTFTVSAQECPEECPTPTPSCPEECPTPTPSCPEECPTPTPIPTQPPVVTVTPTVAPPGPTTPPSNPPPSGPSACVPSLITTIPLIIESKRIDANTIFISWGPYAGLNKFVVRYGFQSDDLRYNTKVTGFSTNIGSLPSNQQIFIQVAATDDCAIGLYGPVVSVQGIQANKVPALPGTGFAPLNILLDIVLPSSIVAILFASLIFIKKKKLLLS